MEPLKIKIEKTEVKELQELINNFIAQKSSEEITILDVYIIENTRQIKHKLDKINLRLDFSETAKTALISFNSTDLITISIIANYADENEMQNNTGIINRIILQLPVEVITIIEQTNKLVANG